MTPKLGTTQRGLGWTHQQQRRRLLAVHRDGTPCPCLDLDDCGPGCPCRAAGRGLPMFRDAALNPDGRALQADHTRARSKGGRTADRLLLATCNGSRGDGARVEDDGGEWPPKWWSRAWY